MKCLCFDALWCVYLCVWVTKLHNGKEMLPLSVLSSGFRSIRSSFENKGGSSIGSDRSR